MPAERHSYFTSPFIALAHRGGALLPANHGKENTLAAFQEAWELGYTHLETDVHLTRDGHLVAFHDEDLERVTGRPGGVAQLTRDELRAVSVGGEPVPLLADLLEALPQAWFNIDLKAPGTEEALPPLLSWHGATDRACVSSFSQSRLTRFRRLAGSRVLTGCGPLETAWMMRDLGINRLFPPPGLVFQVPTHHRVAGLKLPLVTPSFIRRAHAVGRKVHVWTIDDPAQMHQLIDWGVDGLISDAIHVLKEVSIERGIWHG